MTLKEFIAKYRDMLDKIDNSADFHPLIQAVMLSLLTTVLEDAESITQ